MAAPDTALRNWIPRLLLSDVGPRALTMLADLFAGSGASRGFIAGTGHRDDPYRFDIDAGLPNFAVWFPPAGLEQYVVAAPEAIQRWRPGDPLSAGGARGLHCRRSRSRARCARVDRRARRGRWTGGDGAALGWQRRPIIPPDTATGGIVLDHAGFAVGQLLTHSTSKTSSVACPPRRSTSHWAQMPGRMRRPVDASTSPHLVWMRRCLPPPLRPLAIWFVALGSRADCHLAGSTTDSTPEQAARLSRVLNAIATVSNNIAVVVLRVRDTARLAAQAQVAVTDLITLGTPIGPIALTAINTQPTADALRLLHRLLPIAPVDDASGEAEDADLALGRALVTAMMELADPSIRPSNCVRPRLHCLRHAPGLPAPPSLAMCPRARSAAPCPRSSRQVWPNWGASARPHRCPIHLVCMLVCASCCPPPPTARCPSRVMH